MLKLFRTIRKQVMGRGDVKNYLLYAIGEIILVMIGILLALQVNNWNQTRLNHSKEVKALKDLALELNLNQDRIQKKQALRKSIVPKLRQYIQLISAGKADYDAFKDFHTDQFMFGMTNPSSGVIDALISSGEIALVSNDSLKYHLADWGKQLENLYENEQILWQSGIHYIESYAQAIPVPSQDWSDWTDQKLSLTFDDLQTSVNYRNNLVGFEGTNEIVIQECEGILRLIEEIIRLIEEEIRKKE